MFAAQHLGVLNLDIDEVVAAIGGWRDNIGDASAIEAINSSRRLAR